MKKAWILPLTNLICLIHCVGFSLMAIFLPTFLVNLHWEWLEYSVLGLNLIFGTSLLKDIKANIKHYLSFYGLILAGLYLLAFEYHKYFHFIIITLSLYQLSLVYKKHKNKKHNCCNHNH